MASPLSPARDEVLLHLDTSVKAGVTTNFSLRSIATALGGDVVGGQVLAPPVLITPERIAILLSECLRRLPVGSLSTPSPAILGAHPGIMSRLVSE
jgi:hypothetical protein